jgi:hypothetical protein
MVCCIHINRKISHLSDAFKNIRIFTDMRKAESAFKTIQAMMRGSFIRIKQLRINSI